jgi:hypothetical protein
MKKLMKAEKNGTAYEVEILTASGSGLYAFLKRLQTIRKAHPVARRLGRDGDGGLVGGRMVASGAGFKDAPIESLSNSAVARFIGPLNRTVVPGRVEAYKWDMWGGCWWFTPDPVVITDEGHIINGQHRLMAAEELVLEDNKEKAEAEATIADKKADPADQAEARAKLNKIGARTYPQFVVVWGVDKRAAILMDEARRTSTDRRDIAIRYAQSTVR